MIINQLLLCHGIKVLLSDAACFIGLESLFYYRTPFFGLFYAFAWKVLKIVFLKILLFSLQQSFDDYDDLESFRVSP